MNRNGKFEADQAGPKTEMAPLNGNKKTFSIMLDKVKESAYLICVRNISESIQIVFDVEDEIRDSTCKAASVASRHPQRELQDAKAVK